MEEDNFSPPAIGNLFLLDNCLQNYETDLRKRYKRFKIALDKIISNEKGLETFCKSYKTYGINVRKDNSIYCFEWAPKAQQLYLKGDFNNWNKWPYTRDYHGKWELEIPPYPDGSCRIPHGSKLKIAVLTNRGEIVEKVSPWATYVVWEDLNSHQMLWNPPNKYIFKNSKVEKPVDLRIYEAHVGISTEDFGIGTYKYFRENILPRIVNQGYNAIQLMAVMEHSYYGSFGYQVTSFFAVSSRFGTPDDLKELIDNAHGHGIYVLLDIVHSHASKNVLDGLNKFDGTNACFFLDGDKGVHQAWDSRLFDYSELEVKRFLLSNIWWYLDEYQFDGFRFDGVGSMLYYSHGLGIKFTGHYNEYFEQDLVDHESMNYLMLANHVIHSFYPNAITIAEEVTGMPALCRPIEEGGIGFDYRLGMGIPDKWKEVLREQERKWSIMEILQCIMNRRWTEKTVAYAECHDQALVGDKTISFWLMENSMYTGMSLLFPLTHTIERGLNLHKLIRLITHAIGGEGWLNFMGNEFGHPEWLDFPRNENNWSYKYARRQWSLVDDPTLRYRDLNKFDAAMNALEEKYKWLASPMAVIKWADDNDKVVVFERAGLIFFFNFHPTKPAKKLNIKVKNAEKYKIVLDSDLPEFGGRNRLQGSTFVSSEFYKGGDSFISAFMPNTVAMVLCQEDLEEQKQSN